MTSNSDLTVMTVVRSPSAIAAVFRACSAVLSITLLKDKASVPTSSFLYFNCKSSLFRTLLASMSPTASNSPNAANFCMGLLIIPDIKRLKIKEITKDIKITVIIRQIETIVVVLLAAMSFWARVALYSVRESNAFVASLTTDSA